MTNDLAINGTNFTASLYSLTVANGSNVVVNSTNSLKVTDFVNVNTGGSLTFENNSNLVQINNATNTGNIVYKRSTPSMVETDYTFWSSPVAGQTLQNISNGDYSGGYFYGFDSSVDNWTAIPITTPMQFGVGYAMRAQKPNNNSFTINGIFTGVPQNGTQTVSTGPNNASVLLGNPYPSALDADEFLTVNSTKIQGTIYFWTHNTQINAGQYTSNDYASYNTTGGVVAQSGGTVPTGKIASGQGFFATSLGAGSVSFTNAMRLDGSNNPYNNSNFYKTKNIEKHRVWLNLTNTKGAFKQTLLGYVTDATNNFDNRFDGVSFDGNSFVDFYSINQNANLTIQGRALPFDENDEVPLGYRSNIKGTFTINIDHVDGLLINKPIYLEDKLTQTITELKSNNYSFNTEIGSFNNRFVLRYTNKTLGNNDLENQSQKVQVLVKNKQIQINAFDETIDQVAVFDLLGREIFKKQKLNKNELLIANLSATNQTLIVKTSLKNGNIITEKIIF